MPVEGSHPAVGRVSSRLRRDCSLKRGLTFAPHYGVHRSAKCGSSGERIRARASTMNQKPAPFANLRIVEAMIVIFGDQHQRCPASNQRVTLFIEFLCRSIASHTGEINFPLFLCRDFSAHCLTLEFLDTVKALHTY